MTRRARSADRTTSRSRTFTPQELDLFVISVLSLFCELMLIRWLPSTVQIAAYFTNVVLLCAFLGLGVGCLLADRSVRLMTCFPLVLLGLAGLAEGFAFIPIAVRAQGEHFLGFYAAEGQPFLLILLILGSMVTLLFVLMGQELGRGLRGLAPLRGYSINILGSLIGTAAFSLLAAWRTPPVVWFAVAFALSARFLMTARPLLPVGALCAVLTLWLLGWPSPVRIWSPYYRVDLARAITDEGKAYGYEVLANHMFHQYAFDFRQDQEVPLVKRASAIYRVPYQLVHPADVLVIGAGSGNDVAVALAEGAARVDAVEIDPAIADLGRWLHPHKPYLDPRVEVVTNDARAYLNTTPRQYDLIAFGYLDSHRVFSSFSAVRMDNFIYTQESFEAAKRRLKPDGVLVVTYLTFQDWAVARLERELRAVFGDDQVLTYAAQMYDPGDTVVFLAGARTASLPRPPSDSFQLTQRFRHDSINIATDDWPYLYLRERTIPAHYLWMLAAMMALALVSISAAGARTLRRAARFPAFAVLGAGFMLVETKSITRAAVLYGSTWTVSAAVIGIILVMILAANAIASRVTIKPRLCYAGLLAALLLEWLITPSWYLGLAVGPRFVLSSIVIGLPLLFAALLFAAFFKQVDDPPAALAANLGGAIVGGLLEYAAMITGFSMLSWCAIGLYGVSYVIVSGNRTLSRDAG